MLVASARRQDEQHSVPHELLLAGQQNARLGHRRADLSTAAAVPGDVSTAICGTRSHSRYGHSYAAVALASTARLRLAAVWRESHGGKTARLRLALQHQRVPMLPHAAPSKAPARLGHPG